MSTHYRLVPPFLYVPEEQDFSKAWEHFCAKLLNLDRRTSEIYVRNPPEQGVDLYYPSQKIAYQCKSVESGKSGDFNASKAIESMEAAQRIKAQLGWEKYALCVNVDITGTAEAALRKALPDILLLPRSHWVQLCEQYPLEVERNFRQLVEVPRTKVLDAIQNRFVASYSERLQDMLERSSFDIFLYSNRYDTTYRVPVSEEFTCDDLLRIFREFFKLPESMKFESEAVSISLVHYVVFNGKTVSLSKTLEDAGIARGSIVTYWTKFRVSDQEAEFEGNVTHMITFDSFEPLPYEVRRDLAKARFMEVVRQRFRKFDDSLTSG